MGHQRSEGGNIEGKHPFMGNESSHKNKFFLPFLNRDPREPQQPIQSQNQNKPHARTRLIITPLPPSPGLNSVLPPMINSMTRPLNVQELYHRLSPQEDTEDADVDMVKEMLFQCLLDLDEQQQQQQQYQSAHSITYARPQQHQQDQYQAPDHSSHNTTVWWQHQMQNVWPTAEGTPSTPQQPLPLPSVGATSQPIYVLKTETLEELLLEGLTRQKKCQ